MTSLELSRSLDLAIRIRRFFIEFEVNDFRSVLFDLPPIATLDDHFDDVIVSFECSNDACHLPPVAA